MSAYYNEHDPYAAQWLRNLIANNLIAPGDVDERDIQSVSAEDIRGYSQCHFFAGIGGWSYALRLAGIQDDYPLWTGSPPCQPFSQAGKQAGKADERHLWPVFFDLIRECRPHVIFGEQVESAIAHGWLDDLHDDLEGEGYTCGAAIIPACGVGAPHIRQRLFWVGYANGVRCHQRREPAGTPIQGQCAERDREHAQSRQPWELSGGLEGLGCSGGLANPYSSGQFSRSETTKTTRHCDTAGTTSSADRNKPPETQDSFWRNADWLFCRDGKWRAVEPESSPLVDGLPTAVDGRGSISRIGTLRGFGNAIVPQAAAEFVKAFMEVMP